MTATQTNTLITNAQAARQAARQLAGCTTQHKNQAIAAIAQALADHAPEIIAANQADCAAATDLSGTLQARLKLDQAKLTAAIAGVKDVGRLADPVGQIQMHRQLDEQLILKRISCPLGVIGVIFESRPDAVIQIASLAIKSGNAAILKGGREATRTCTVLVKAIQGGLTQVGIDPQAIQLLTTREETIALLELHEYIDLIIPRGSNELVRFIQQNTQIPVLGHADGICHVYVDAHADLDQAVQIVVDSKTQYPAACNTAETLLVHQEIASAFLPKVAAILQEKSVQLRGDDRTRQVIATEPATEADWRTEYGDLVLAIRVVDSLEDAIAHINTYGSRHTEAIVTTNPESASLFLNQVNAAGVFHNCSTRFADGFRYGFGAEVGISTAILPPRGPVGLEGLVTYKYQLTGIGQIVADYSGPHAKPFLHRDIT